MCACGVREKNIKLSGERLENREDDMEMETKPVKMRFWTNTDKNPPHHYVYNMHTKQQLCLVSKLCFLVPSFSMVYSYVYFITV